MTRSTTCRALALLAVAAGLLLAGCSAGQIAETARKNPSVPGANADRQLFDSRGKVIGSVAVRDVVVAYRDPKGYERGGTAPLEARVFNDTQRAVTVTVEPDRPETPAEQVVQATSVELVGGDVVSAPTVGAAQPAPTAGASPGTPRPDGASPSGSPVPPAAPASFEIPAGGFVVLSQASGRYLRLIRLNAPLTAGMSVPLRFQFSNGLELAVTAPVTNPLSAPERARPEVEEAPGEH